MRSGLILAVLLLAIGVYADEDGQGLDHIYMPEAETVYTDSQECRYLGRVEKSKGVSLFRICPESPPAMVSEYSPGGSSILEATEGTILHFFNDHEYPLWLQPKKGMPYPLGLREDYVKEEFLNLARAVDNGQLSYFYLLEKWYGNTVSFNGSLAYGVAYGTVHMALALLTDIQLLRGVSTDIGKMNTVSSYFGSQHVSSSEYVLEHIIPHMFSSEAIALGVWNTLYSVAESNFIFRLFSQGGGAYVLNNKLPHNDDWPERQRWISRLSNGIASTLSVAYGLGFAESFSLKSALISLAGNYFFSGKLYEKYGIASSITHDMTYYAAWYYYRRFLTVAYLHAVKRVKDSVQ